MPTSETLDKILALNMPIDKNHTKDTVEIKQQIEQFIYEELIGEDLSHEPQCASYRKPFEQPNDMCICSAKIANYVKSEQRKKAAEWLGEDGNN